MNKEIGIMPNAEQEDTKRRDQDESYTVADVQ